MATYKRINQLGQTYSVGDNDFLPVDVQGASETQKVKKSDLFYGYVSDAPNDENTKNWTWARRNGNWYRIYPDDYVFEAPTDGKIYVRVNGEWVSVSGVSGDMLQSVYDTHGRATDIFDYVDNAVGTPNNASESLLGAPIVKTGKFIYKDYGIETEVLNCLIYGETVDKLENPLLPKGFSNKSILAGIDNIGLYVIGRDLLTDRTFSIGSINNETDVTVVKTTTPAKVNAGETYTFEDVEQILEVKVVSVNRLGEPDGVFSTTYLPNKSTVTIPNGVDYVRVELQFSDKREIDLEEFYNYYLLGIVVFYKDQFKEFHKTMDTPLYSLDLVASDYLDINKELIYHNIKKDTLTYDAGWTVSTIGSGFKNSTIPFELSIGQTSWVDSSLIYGDSNVLPAKSIDDFAVNDAECIAFSNGKVYIRISYEHLQRNAGQTDQNYENGLEGFLYSNPIDVIYKLDSPIITDLNKTKASGQSELVSTFDSITNFFAYGITSISEEEILISQCDLEIKFDNVINHVVRKRGDEMTGDLLIEPNSTLYVRSIEGYPQDNLDSSLYLNRNSESKIYANGENPVLDLRDFSTDLDWEPKAKTIQEKEAKDQRIVNAEYVARDYAPIDSPNLVGVPTAPKATQLGTNQIATGEFLKENYFNKTEADENYIHSVDGEAGGNLVLNETLPKDVANKKRIPNVEFLENYYYNSDEVNAQFAPIDSPHLTGIPTTPTPDEVTGTQIANVDYVKNNYYSKNGGPIYGDVTVEGTPDKKGDLVVKGNINNAKLDSDGNIINKNLAVVTDSEGNIVTTDVTTSEIQTLKNIKGNIQSQIDNIPKYNYLSGLQTIIPEQEGNIKADLQLYGETPQGGTTEAPVALTRVDSVQVCGNNLFVNKATEGTTNNGVTFTLNSDKSITVNGTNTSSSRSAVYHTSGGVINTDIAPGTYIISGGSAPVVVEVVIYKANGETKYFSSSLSSTVFNIEDGDILKQSYVLVRAGQTVDNVTVYPMLNVGSTALPYEPYNGSITQLPIPRELHRIGDVADKCVTRVKSVYDNKVTLNGKASENWQLSANGVFYYENALINNALKAGACDRYRFIMGNNGSTDFITDKTFGFYSGSPSRVMVRDNSYTTVTEFKSYLASNPLTVYYQSTAYDGTNGLDVCMTEYQTGFVELDGTESWFPFGSSPCRFFVDLPPASRDYSNFVGECSHFAWAWGGYISKTFFVQANTSVSGAPISRFVFVMDNTNVETVEDWEAYLAAQKAAGTPVQLVYQLATPEQYATDPIEDIPYSSNTNYISGGEIEVINYYGVGNGQWPSQSEVDKKVIPLLEKAYPDASTWDAVTVRVTLQPSDKIRDLLYYYTDGTLGSPKGWYYLYDLSTSINRANGTTAGIVEDSTNGDVTFADGSPTVHHSKTADKLSTARTINGTAFDGSANITTSKWGATRTFNATGAVTGSVAVDGSQNISLNTDYNVIQLTNEDLNNIKVPLGFYYASGGNTVVNMPEGFKTSGFGLRCERIADGFYLQTISMSGFQFKRFFDGNANTWSPWYRVYSEADKPTSTEIGAIPSSGGTYTGWLEGGTNNVGLQWTVDDGTLYRVKTYKPSNIFQITAKPADGIETSVMEIKGTVVRFLSNVALIKSPTADNHAVNKKYVDDAMASAGTGDMLKNVYDTNNNGIVDNAEKVNGLTVQTAVPANAKFTDTTYGVVSTSANGLAPKLPGNTTSYLRGDGTWATISVPSGAVSGVKGNAESTYRTGNVNLTPANIGAIPNGGAASLTDELTINASGHPITVSNGNISIEDANISIVNGELNYDAGTY